MGFSISWIAVQADAADAVCRTIGLRRTGATANYSDFDISGIMLFSGWYLVVFEDMDHPLQSEDSLRRVSEAFPVLRCLIEEHAMYSSAELWHRCEQIWRIAHDLQAGKRDLAVTGTVPAAFDSIRTHVMARQDDHDKAARGLPVDDVFDAPLLLAREVTGYKHSEALEEEKVRKWEELVAAA